jgi:type II secretory pathway pseudopilin PulG
MAALLVAMSVMAVWWSVALPVWSTQARREKEAELIFRGEQYARAIAMFQRRYGNAIPPSIDVLLEQKFLRKKYQDPITGDDFEIIGPASPALAQAGVGQLSAAADTARARGTGRRGADAGQPGLGTARAAGQRAVDMPATLEARARQTSGAPREAQPAMPLANGVIGVRSRSTAKALRRYNGADNYNEWLFLGTQQTTRPAAPSDSTPTPGGPVLPGRGGIRSQGPQLGRGADRGDVGLGRRGREGVGPGRQGP